VRSVVRHQEMTSGLLKWIRGAGVVVIATVSFEESRSNGRWGASGAMVVSISASTAGAVAISFAWIPAWQKFAATKSGLSSCARQW